MGGVDARGSARDVALEADETAEQRGRQKASDGAVHHYDLLKPAEVKGQREMCQGRTHSFPLRRFSNRLCVSGPCRVAFLYGKATLKLWFRVIETGRTLLPDAITAPQFWRQAGYRRR